jgi:Clostripain family
MSALDALDDYAPITKYYLASEATEPGHGWNYEIMSSMSSALDLAIEFVDTFAKTPQGQEHQTPKTLGVIDSTKYLLFKEAFDTLILEFSAILESDDDANFYLHLNRARSASLEYEGYDDYPGYPGSKYTSVSNLRADETITVASTV